MDTIRDAREALKGRVETDALTLEARARADELLSTLACLENMNTLSMRVFALRDLQRFEAALISERSGS